MKIKSERKEVKDIEYRLNYFIDKSGGFSFPCDKNGNILDGMAPEAISNLEFCRNHPEKFINPGEVEKIVHRYMEPAIGICNRCGAEVRLENQYLGACQCPECFQWYNLWGQELIPPTSWDDDL